MLKQSAYFFVFAALLLFGPNAQALTISPTASTGDPATLDDFDSGGTQSVTSDASATIADQAGESGQTAAAYKYHVWGDTYGGNHNQTYTHELTAEFTVLADPGVSYDITFSTSRLGHMGIADDTTWYSAVGSSAHLGALTGTINGGSNEAGLALAGADLNSSHSQTSDEIIPINQSSTGTLLTGSGNTTWTVVTTWTSRVHSYYDEAGLSFGDAVDLQYLDISPNPDDGVWTQASVLITAVPEPSTALLLGLGLTGLLFRQRSLRS